MAIFRREAVSDEPFEEGMGGRWQRPRVGVAAAREKVGTAVKHQREVPSR